MKLRLLVFLALALACIPNVFSQAGSSGRTLIYDGSAWTPERTPNVYKNLSAVVITSETTIWTPATGKRFRFFGFCLTQGVATGAVTIKDNTAGTTILILPPHTLGQALCADFRNGILSSAANNVLTATGASTETLTGFIYGTEE